MIKVANPAGLEGLINLDRQGVDIRPTLLRVITDQYLHKEIHTQDEERQFTELALRLIDETEVGTRAAVARRLAPHSSAPRAIILQLARDMLEVAEPVLLLSPCLAPADLDAIAAERGPCYAELIARRRPPETGSKAAPPARAAERAAPNAPGASLGDTAPPPATGPIGSGPAQARELCELFFAAGAEERRLILISLDYIAGVPPRSPCTMQQSEIWHLESAALQHNKDTVIHDLERALGVSRQFARRIVDDELGEPVVVAAKALGLPAEVLQRILLFMNPCVGQSVERVYRLASLCGEVTLDAARRLVEIWRNANPIETLPASHEAHRRDAVQSARQALSDISRRQSTRSHGPSIATPRRTVAFDSG